MIGTVLWPQMLLPPISMWVMRILGVNFPVSLFSAFGPFCFSNKWFLRSEYASKSVPVPVRANLTPRNWVATPGLAYIRADPSSGPQGRDDGSANNFVLILILAQLCNSFLNKTRIDHLVKIDRLLLRLAPEEVLLILLHGLA